MPRIVWAVCCERPIVDMQTNNLSLIGLIEELTLPAPRVVLGGPMHIVCLWERSLPNEEAEEFDYRVQLVRPDGTLAYEGESMTMGIPANILRLRTLLAFAGAPFDQSGRYEWVVQLAEDGEWSERFRLPLNVKLTNLSPPS